MKNFLKQNYHLHLLGGALIGWVLSLTFSGVPIVIQYFITIFVSTLLGIGWEWGWTAYNKSPIDYRDVFWGVVGSILSLTIFTIF
jgi:hypothetical protein